ncbi:MAG: 4-hydroxythreonine-4-phosphate dehydrogenase PdxA [Candidatus Omnitrophota bacterium]
MIKPKVGITIGDPSGIGPAITLKALARLKQAADFVVIGDKWVFDRLRASGFGLSDISFIDLKNVYHKNFRFGRIKAEYGRASIEYLDEAMRLWREREIDCLVTAPISKEAVNLAGFDYAGHTEYFADKTGVQEVVMMLLNDKLKFSLVTRHMPLSNVAKSLNKPGLYSNIFLTLRSLREIFGITEPRIVVCGVNPHASDNGLIGNEENSVIKPCLKKLEKAVKFRIDGPLPSDVAISRALDGRYDCVIAMYHDQALIPLKLTGTKTGVNLTLGLPFIRTSPLHGTAFDIAKNPKLADPCSLIAAIKLAVKCASNLKKV